LLIWMHRIAINVRLVMDVAAEIICFDRVGLVIRR